MHNPNLATVILTATVIVLTATGAAAELAKDTIAISDGELTVFPINHATFVMTGAGKVIYVDPVGGAEVFGDFEPPDLILITHIHGDHTSAETMQTISTEATVVLAPASVAEKLGDDTPGKLHILANGESFDWEGITVDAIPAYNLTEERKGFHPEGRDNGYVVTIGGKRIYIAGDTEDIPEMRELTDIDAAFVCMNLPYTMTVERAADAVLAFAPKIVYPYHYRGKDGMSDLEAFKKAVSGNPEIEVRLLEWY
jgi:L-ascorbate metabolism protein UlaG (beta-lactamase superfamily)